MSAVLSPAEQQEVTRFGVHDEEILRDMTEHFGDEVLCVGTERPAVAMAKMRCCGMQFPICAHHIEVSRELISTRHVRCDACSRDLTPFSFDEAVELRYL